MNLCLDFGNTRIKAAIFDTDILVHETSFESEIELEIFIKTQTDILKCIVSSVTQAHKKFIEKFKNQFQILEFNLALKTPLINLYKSHTLGTDRLLASIGAHFLSPNKNVLTIDCGTCIKYNFVNEKNEFLGGAISPGINLRLKSLHQYTSALPLLQPDFAYNNLIGTTTQESMLSGTLLASTFEIDETINQYQNNYKKLAVYLTGGDAPFFGSNLKNTFFASPNLIMIGLNHILNLND